MTTTTQPSIDGTSLGARSAAHLWGHFARHGEGITPPVITRGEGVRIFDDRGRSYLDDRNCL